MTCLAAVPALILSASAACAEEAPDPGIVVMAFRAPVLQERNSASVTVLDEEAGIVLAAEGVLEITPQPLGMAGRVGQFM